MVTTAGRYDLAIVSSPLPVSSDAPMSGPLGVDGPFGRFADGLLAADLPDLADPARRSTVEFVCRRAGQIPGPLRLGVVALSLTTGVSLRCVGASRTIEFLGRTRLPFVAELARMVRSLGYAYIWETWPDTSPTGAPA